MAASTDRAPGKKTDSRYKGGVPDFDRLLIASLVTVEGLDQLVLKP
jgi:hypothetical protein